MWSSSPYAEPPPFIWMSLFSGTHPTLAGTPGTSTGNPLLFAHSAPTGSWATETACIRGHGGGPLSSRWTTTTSRHPTTDPGHDSGREVILPATSRTDT